jgi:integrase
MSKQPAKPRHGEPIALTVTKSGETRYRTVLDYAAVGQPRQQRRATFATLTEARAHVASVRAKRDAGSLPTRDRETFDQLADEYLADRRPKIRGNTYDGYVSALKPARVAFGQKPVGQVTTADVERLVRAMAARKLTRRTTAMTLGRLRAVLARALRQGAVIRNVADGVEAQGKDSVARQALTVDEYRAVAHAAATDRLAAAWLLTLHGMRRSEVLGLRWQDVQLAGDQPSVTISHGRTGTHRRLNGDQLTAPKTRRGARVLPLTDDMAAALKSWRAQLADDLGLAAVGPKAFVVVNEAGEPVPPEAYSAAWFRLCTSAGLTRRVVLHAARHTSVTEMRAAGVPDRIVAAWHGHDESVMRAVYDHADQDRAGLEEAAQVLASIRRVTA